MKRCIGWMIAGIILSGCASKESSFASELQSKMEKEVSVIETLNDLSVDQTRLVEVTEEVLTVASKNFDEVSELLEEGRGLSHQVVEKITEDLTVLVLTEKESEKLEDRLSKLKKSDQYVLCSELLDSFKSYKEALVAYLEADRQLAQAYYNFFNEVQSESAFNDVESWITIINQSMQAKVEAYVTYQESFESYQKAFNLIKK